MLSLRAWLVATILLATALFVVGISIEPSDHDHEADAAAPAGRPASSLGPAANGGDFLLVDADGDDDAAPESEALEAQKKRAASKAAEPKASDRDEGEDRGTGHEVQSPPVAGQNANPDSDADVGHEQKSDSDRSEDADHGDDEYFLGVNSEATPFVILAVLISLTLAGAAWTWSRRQPVLVVVALAMFVFAVFDVREVVHQGEDADTGIAVLAAVVAISHLAACGIAVAMARLAGPAARASGGTATVGP